MGMLDVLKPKSKDELNSVIDTYIKDFEDTYMPMGFQWRKGQKEAVEQIVQTYLEKKYKVVILDAPVGSGKSLIAMAVSHILNITKKRGYILASEISLQDQYQNDINRFKLPWGLVKGVDHYKCTDNDEKHSLGTCKIRNINPRKMLCYNECPYFSARDMAVNADTAVLNYNYWLIMQNFVNSHNNEDQTRTPLFPPRDFTICDEGHKILDIVQSHYSPRFTKGTVEKLKKLSDFFRNHKVRDHTLDVDVIESAIEEMWNTEDQDNLHGHLCSIEKALKTFLISIEKLKDRVEEEYQKKKPPIEWREALFLSDWVKDIHCKVEDYNYIISHTTTRNIIKNPTGKKELTFNCLGESYMMHKYFHNWTGFTVLMSATFADPSKYLRSIALGTAKYIKMESNFDFTRSPIYFYNERRMTYNQIESNLPWLFETINKILDDHHHQSGIIHTASYDLALKIHNGLTHKNKRRVLVYNGTEEKRQVLEMLKVNKDKVLIGPSLLEGLDLKDEWSRFQIFAKVPYLSLSDKFVAAKLKINPEWYREKAILSILQGTGRSVRSENDWAVTYILDGAMADLIHGSRKSFPVEFLNRIKVIKE